MKRALALVGLVVLITYGVWFYLPPFGNSTVVMYRQPAIPGQTDDQWASPVMCTSGNWQLEIEWLAQTEASFVYSRLSSLQKTTDVAVQLEHTQAIDRQTALSLEVYLTDNLGHSYASSTATNCTPLPQNSDGGSSWRLIFHYPGLDEKANQIGLSAKLGQVVFDLPTLPIR